MPSRHAQHGTQAVNTAAASLEGPAAAVGNATGNGTGTAAEVAMTAAALVAAVNGAAEHVVVREHLDLREMQLQASPGIGLSVLGSPAALRSLQVRLPIASTHGAWVILSLIHI